MDLLHSKSSTSSMKYVAFMSILEQLVVYIYVHVLPTLSWVVNKVLFIGWLCPSVWILILQ